MNIVGLIPARGGSKGIPRKNLVPLRGRPLLAHTCEAARGSRRLSRCIVSTDDPEIARVAASFGIEAPFLRPAALAADDTAMIDVMRHALEWLTRRGEDHVDALVLLQPTSPLRRADHVDTAVAQFLESGADTIVSVVGVPHQFTPFSLLVCEGDRLRPYEPSAPALRRQDKPKLYARNGPAVLVVRTAVLESGRLYGDDTRGFEMLPSESVDVDGADDLALAEFLMSRQGNGR